MTEEEWESVQDREYQYHAGIWKLLNEIWELQNELKKLKGEEDDEDWKNIIPIRDYGPAGPIDNSGSGGR
jgi:hypothetical protein